ncbi:MAG: sugar phosphate isomerase/epimerase [Clostridia bacterium]|nr:sugar phosphate isomerase/epimerase [Clostridia bacterium]
MSKKIVSLSLFPFQHQYNDFRAIEIAKEIGVKAVDFSTDLARFDCRNPNSVYSKGDEAVTEYFSKIKHFADKDGVTICMTHGRGAGFKNIKEEDEALIENARLDCLAASVLGAPVCVIHAVTTIFMGPDCPPEFMHKLNFDMFARIIPFAKKHGVKLATETFGDAFNYNTCDFFGNIDEFIKSYNDVCAVEDFKEHFKICVDTGHSNKATRFNNNPEPAEVIRKLGSNIIRLHLNDNDKITDQHKIPMTGCINWEDVFDALDDIDYNGYYNMELSLGYFGKEYMAETAEFAVKMMQNYLDRRYSKD